MLSPHVVELEVREPYKLWLRFDDGIAGTKAPRRPQDPPLTPEIVVVC